MARIRTIKPEFWTDEAVLECSTNARLLFIGMWNFADDMGRLQDSPRQLRACIFPGDGLSIDAVASLIDELVKHRLILRYTKDYKSLIQIKSWHHQRISKPQPPRFPGPFDNHSGNGGGTFRDGKEGKGKEGIERNTPYRECKESPKLNLDEPEEQADDKPKRQRRRQIAAGEIPKPCNRQYAETCGIGADRFGAEWEAWKDYHRARGNTFADVDACWRTWCRNSAKYGGVRNIPAERGRNGGRHCESDSEIFARLIAEAEERDGGGSVVVSMGGHRLAGKPPSG